MYRIGKDAPEKQTYAEWLRLKWLAFRAKMWRKFKIPFFVSLVLAFVYGIYFFTGPAGCGCHK